MTAAPLTRWAQAAAAEPDAPAVFGAQGTLSRRRLLEASYGAANAAVSGERCRVKPDDVCVWLPWLAGCAVGGGVFELDPSGAGEPAPSASTPAEVAAADSPCIATSTTGTTGAPHVVLRDRAGWQRCAETEETLLGLTPTERILSLGAPAFSLTLYAAFRALHLGAAFGVLNRITRQAASQLTAELRPTVIYGAPPLVTALAQAHRAGTPSSGVKRIVTGGARLTGAQLNILRTAWPRAYITTFYGAAETSFIAVNQQPRPHHPDDAGMLFPGVEAAVSHGGRLRVRTPYAALGTARADGTIAPLTDAQGWLALPDRVSLPGGGRIRVYGRADACLNIGGALIDPEPMERVLERFSWVAEAAVVAVPDPRRSARAAAFVVAAGHPPANARALLRRAAKAAGCRPVPERIECLCETPPRTPGGKLDRRELVRRLSEHDDAGGY